MSEFTDYLKEVFEPFGPVSARRMFGGYGLFYDGLMIGLVADDTLYLKADDELKPRFEERQLGPFEYNKNGKVMQMSYYQAPEEILESPHEAAQWAHWSYEAALRARPKNKPGPKTGRAAAAKKSKTKTKAKTKSNAKAAR